LAQWKSKSESEVTQCLSNLIHHMNCFWAAAVHLSSPILWQTSTSRIANWHLNQSRITKQRLGLML